MNKVLQTFDFDKLAERLEKTFNAPQKRKATSMDNDSNCPPPQNGLPDNSNKFSNGESAGK